MLMLDRISRIVKVGKNRISNFMWMVSIRDDSREISVFSEKNK